MEEIIVKYFGDLRAALDRFENVKYSILYGNFAVISFPPDMIYDITSIPEIQYIEYPVRLFFEQADYKGSSCIRAFTEETGLTGRNVLIAIIDSGIDVFHNCFVTDSGTTRFISYWDQTVAGKSPEGFFLGNEYSREDIDRLISEPEAFAPNLFLNTDHGTAVAGIAAGNAAGYRGVAPSASLIGVKLGSSQSYPKTSELMQAVDYCLRKAYSLRLPLVINLSFGNTYGSHTGNSLLEDYLNLAATYGKTCIVCGTGNEGASACHAGGPLNKSYELLLSVGVYQREFSIQLWKAFADNISFRITSPSGFTTGYLKTDGGVLSFKNSDFNMNILIGRPTPLQTRQGIYIDIIPLNLPFREAGIWKIEVEPEKTTTDRFDMWLPLGEALEDTMFLTSDPDVTLTIPSTASNVISVGSYNSLTNSLSTFSGRGYTALNMVKPDLIAPGEDITAPLSGLSHNLYSSFTGTSFSTPIVSGACALLMEWGIINGNDENLFGQKIKAYLHKGARPLSDDNIPNQREGYGKLCLSDSLRFLKAR